MYKRGYTCRCSRCFARKTLRMRPEHYLRAPKCWSCRAVDTMFVDWYRIKVEYNKPQCDCHGYGFKHRNGSGWCIHNKTPRTQDEIARRFGMMERAA